MSEVDGIVLRLNPYRESDYIAVILTEDKGKITCLARNARKSKHRFFSSLQVFDAGKFLLSEKKGQKLIEGITNPTSFPELAKHPSSFLLACIFTEAVDILIPEEDPEYSDFLQPLIKALKLLQKVKNSSEQLLVASWFFTKISVTTGIDPRSSIGIFRKDDLEWLSYLVNDEMLSYEPIEASERAFIGLLDFIEQTFQVRLKVKKQLNFPWKF